jgi:hypothetical protein
MRIQFFVILAIFCCLSMASNAYAQAGTKTGISVLTNIKLGMELSEIVRLDRELKNIYESDVNSKSREERLRNIEKNPNIALYEEIKNSAYSDALFFFKEKKLIKIRVDGVPQYRGVAGLSPFIEDLAKQYGRPTDIGLMQAVSKAKNPKSVCLFWRLNDQVIYARFEYPLAENETSSFFDLNLVAGNWPYVESQAPKLMIPTEDDKEKLLNPVIALVNKFNTPIPLLLPNTASKSVALPQPNIKDGDYLPIWDENNNLIFTTYRQIEGEPPLLPPQTMQESEERTLYPFKRLALRKSDGQINALMRMTYLSGLPAWASTSQRLAFTERGQVYIFDLKNHVMGKMNDRSRTARWNPSWNINGTMITMSGTHSVSDRKDEKWDYDEDIFIAKVNAELSYSSALENRCVARMAGRDILPIFSFDQAWIYFAHQGIEAKGTKTNGEKSSRSTTNWSIYRVRADKRWNEGNIPEKIAGGLNEPDRISWFPDGKRLLISFLRNGFDMAKAQEIRTPPVIVDTDNKKIVPLNLPILYDAALSQGWPLLIREATIRQNDGNLLFSALCWSGKDKDEARSYIYTCRLDGSNLQRVTTSADQPLKNFKYRQSGVTALNAWEKLQPKPNMGKQINIEENSLERSKISKGGPALPREHNEAPSTDIPNAYRKLIEEVKTANKAK